MRKKTKQKKEKIIRIKGKEKNKIRDLENNKNKVYLNSCKNFLIIMRTKQNLNLIL
jgi:hypothetical protein